MSATSENKNRMIFYEIHKPMLPVNAPAPKARQILFQWFRFSDSIKRMPHNILDELIDALDHPLIILLPV